MSAYRDGFRQVRRRALTGMKRRAKRTRRSLGRLAQPVWGTIRAAEAAWNRLAKEDLERIGTGRHAPRLYKFFPALVALLVGAVAGTWLLFAALARLTGSHMSWWRPEIGSLDPGRLFDVTRSTISFAAVFGGLFAVLYAYRKQRVDEAAGHRADAESLGKRYGPSSMTSNWSGCGLPEPRPFVERPSEVRAR